MNLAEKFEIKQLVKIVQRNEQGGRIVITFYFKGEPPIEIKQLVTQLEDLGCKITLFENKEIHLTEYFHLNDPETVIKTLAEVLEQENFKVIIGEYEGYVPNYKYGSFASGIISHRLTNDSNYNINEKSMLKYLKVKRVDHTNSEESNDNKL